MAHRIAFITGASRGIGRACAFALSSAGAKVVLAARQVEVLEAVATEIRAAGGDAYVVGIDLASQDSIKEAFSKASKEFGRIDILIINPFKTNAPRTNSPPMKTIKKSRFFTS